MFARARWIRLHRLKREGQFYWLDPKSCDGFYARYNYDLIAAVLSFSGHLSRLPEERSDHFYQDSYLLEYFWR